MLSITSEQRELYLSDSSNKGLKLYFPTIDLTISETNIISESFELIESICSDTDLSFGKCLASQLKLTLHDIDTDLSGLSVIVTQTVDTFETPIGAFFIDSCNKQDDTSLKDIIAYDTMTLFDVDVSTWYNALTFPLTLSQFRASLLAHLNITEDTTNLPLPNDNMTVEKTIEPSQLSAREVIRVCEEINGCFGHINRSGEFTHIILKEMHEDYPQDDYPSDDLPEIEPYDEYIDKSLYIKIDFEEYRVLPIDKIQIRQEENDVGCIYGTGTNAYIIQGNFLAYGKSAADLQTIAENVSTNIFKRGYRPYTASQIGLPYVEVGDFIKYDANDTTAGYVFMRTLTGTQALQDTYEANGSEEQTQNFGVSNEIIQLKGKSAKIEKSVEAVKVTITDLESDTTSKFEQTAFSINQEVARAIQSEESLIGSINVLAGQVVLKVDTNGNVGYVSLTGDPDTDLTSIEIKSDNISLEGLVTANSNFKVLLDGSIEAVNCKLNGILTSETTNGKLEIDGANIQGWDAQGNTMLILNNMGTMLCQDIICYNSATVDGSPVVTDATLANKAVGYATSAGTAEYATSAGSTATSAKTYEVAGVAMPYNNSLSPLYDAQIALGSINYRWSSICAASGTIQTSDRNKKYDIRELDARYMDFAKMITPKLCKMKEGTSGRDHVTFIAQEVEDAMTACGITDMEFAGLVKSPIYSLKLKDADGNDTREYDTTSDIVGYDYALRYDEFIPLLFALYNSL